MNIGRGWRVKTVATVWSDNDLGQVGRTNTARMALSDDPLRPLPAFGG